MRKLRVLIPVVALLVPVLAAPSAADDARAFPGTCRGKMVTIAGTNGDDILTGVPGVRDVIHGGPGNDTIRGGDRGDTICGGPGDDWIDGENGHDFIDAGGGKDIVLGGGGRDSLEGKKGNDQLWPEEGVGGYADGGKGADKIFIDREGDNDIFGGGGSDTVNFRFAPTGIKVDLSIGHYDTWPLGGTPPIGSLIFDVEHVVGSTFDDVITGDAGNNSLSGGWGNDYLAGLAGADWINGGPGTDTADGGAGMDFCTRVEFPTNC